MTFDEFRESRRGFTDYCNMISILTEPLSGEGYVPLKVEDIPAFISVLHRLFSNSTTCTWDLRELLRTCLDLCLDDTPWMCIPELLRFDQQFGLPKLGRKKFAIPQIPLRYLI